MENNDYRHIENLYKAGFEKEDYAPSKSFRFKFSLMLLYVRLNKIVAGLVLIGILVISAFFLFFNSGSTNEVHKLTETNNNEVAKEIPDQKFSLNKPVVEEIVTEPLTIPNDEIVPVKVINENDNNVQKEIIIDNLNNVRETYFLMNTMPFKTDCDIAGDLEKEIVENSNGNAHGRNGIFNNAPKVYALSFFVSPNITSSSLSGSNSEYNRFRQDNESPALSWSFGANVQYNFNNWFFEFGLSYSTYRNKRNYNFNYQVIDSAASYYTYDTNWVWIYDPPNLEYPVMVGIDTNWVSVYDEYQVVDNGYNEWKYLDVPILLGYRYNRNLFSLEIATGVSIGVLLSQKVSVPVYPDCYEMIKQNTISDDNQINYRFIIRAGALYQITPDWSIFAQPYFQKSLSPILINEGSVNQSLTFYGLNFGLKYSF